MLFLWLLFISSTNGHSCNQYKACANETLNMEGLGSINCDGMKSCLSSAFLNFYDVGCNGDSSCSFSSRFVNATNIDTISHDCAGYGSCYKLSSIYIDISTRSYEIFCEGTLSCSNISLKCINNNNDEPIPLVCDGLHSCINISVYQEKQLTIRATSAFELYNSHISTGSGGYASVSIESHLYGYYSGYGATFACYTADCGFHCYGLSCLNLKCSGECWRECGDSSDLNCQSTLDVITSSNDIYDYVGDYINTMLQTDFNYTIFPHINNDNIKHIDYNDKKNNICQITFTGNNSQSSKQYINGTICCLGSRSCAGGKSILKINTNESRDIYCNGKESCADSDSIIGTSIYCKGASSCMSSNITFSNLLACEGAGSCSYTMIKDGKTVLCIGSGSCQSSTIINVTNIIATGSVSLTHSTIINVDNIYVLGDELDNAITISNDSVSNNYNPNIYCQYRDCHLMISQKVYCKTQKYNFNNITSYLESCSLYPPSPTFQPSVVPTHVPSSNPTDVPILNQVFDKIDEYISNVTIVLPIVFAIISIILILISCRMRSRKNKKNTELSIRASINNNNINDDNTINEDYLYVNYNSGYGKNVNHLVIVMIFFQIYDIYTDISYLFIQYAQEYYYSFYIFLSSMIVTIVINIIIVSIWLKYELSINVKFRKWFYEHVGIISSLLVILIFSDASLICSLFTSQIFGHLAFYSPISINAVNKLNLSAILSIFFEHLPQISIQIYNIRFSNRHDGNFNITVIAIGTLIVTCIDTIVITVKGLFWLLLDKTSTNEAATAKENEKPFLDQEIKKKDTFVL